MEPPTDQGIIDGKAVEHCDTMDYKFTIDGKKLKVDEGGTAIRRSTNWRPHQIPVGLWNKNPSLRERDGAQCFLTQEKCR